PLPTQAPIRATQSAAGCVSGKTFLQGIFWLSVNVAVRKQASATRSSKVVKTPPPRLRIASLGSLGNKNLQKMERMGCDFLDFT
ncbi:MAG: hypothetical protein ACK55P_06560, partial [Planctomyces sp.]